MRRSSDGDECSRSRASSRPCCSACAWAPSRPGPLVTTAVTPSGSFVGQFIAPGSRCSDAGVGLLALALFSFLAAVYLTVEAEGTELQDDFRARALWAARRCS